MAQTIYSHRIITGLICFFTGLSLSYSQFLGGNATGFSNAGVINTVCSVVAGNPFAGGNADGHSNAGVINTVCSVVAGNPFAGGNADGHSDAGVINTVCSVVAGNPFAGGNADGHSDAQVLTFNPISCEPLPIELLYFTAILTTNKEVLCQWATATEINNNYFIVERTRNGIHYDFVGKTNGAGNSSSTLYYSTIDPDPYQGVSYYRLKQVDFDGSYTYSHLVPINLESIEIISIFPTPASDNISYLIGSTEASNVTITVVDVFGRVGIIKEESIDAGVTQKQLNVSALASGSYMLRITTQNMEKIQKQFIIR